MNIRSNKYIFIVIVLIGSLGAQNYDELKKIQRAYEDIIRERMAKEAISEEISRDDIVIDEIPTQILVKPDDILTYYVQKIARIRIELAELQDVLPLISKEKKLPFYGYDNFYVRDTISFWQNRALPPDYPLGPGDEIIISIWGAAENRIQEVISRDGTIFAQNVGLLYLGGMTISDADEYIATEYKKVYSTLRGNNPTTFLDMTIGKVKGINVQLTGAVNSPGVHAVHPFSTLSMILAQTGGIDTTGSLRSIIIFRDNIPVDTLDLYHLLNGASTPRNSRLLDWDRIHVPPRHSQVAANGAVKQPAYYEALPGESVAELISFSGGTLSTAGPIVVVNHVENSAVPPQLIPLADMHSIPIFPGDSIHVPVMQPLEINVEIDGTIPSPGPYPWYAGMTIRDLLTVSGGLHPHHYAVSDWANAELSRYNIADGKYKLVPIDILALLADSLGANIELKPFDRLHIPSKQGLIPTRYVTVVGLVHRPGKYTLLNEDDNLESVLSRAGDLLPSAFKGGIIIERDTLRLGWSGSEVLLQNRDVIRVPYRPNAISVIGAVHNPGYFTWEQGRSVNYYLHRAGGVNARGDKKYIFVKYANGEGASITRWRKPEVRDGATIVVSEKEIYKDKKSGLEVFQSVTGTLGSLATVILFLNNQN